MCLVSVENVFFFQNNLSDLFCKIQEIVILGVCLKYQ